MEKGGFCYKYVAGLRRLMFATKSHDAIGGGGVGDLKLPKVRLIFRLCKQTVWKPA